VPADLSPSIPTGLTALSHADPLPQAELPHLPAYLTTVTNPKARARRRQALVAILLLARYSGLAAR
jgi:hypothetical protein